MAHDSKYHDGLTDKDHTYNGTKYKEEGVTFRLDKDLGGDKELKFWYNHQNGKDGYPITARDWRYWSQADWNRIIERTTRPGGYGNTDNPGYRNLFSLDALSGSYNAYRNNDIDISYTFKKIMEWKALFDFIVRNIITGALIGIRAGFLLMAAMCHSQIVRNGVTLSKIINSQKDFRLHLAIMRKSWVPVTVWQIIGD